METTKNNYKNKGIKIIFHLVRIQFKTKIFDFIIPLILYSFFSFFVILTLEKTVLLNILFQIIILISILQNRKDRNINTIYKSLPLEKSRFIISKYFFAIILAFFIIFVFYAAALIIIITNNNVFQTVKVLNYSFFYYIMLLPLIFRIIIYFPINLFFDYLRSYVILLISLMLIISIGMIENTIDKIISNYYELINQISESMFFLIISIISFICLIISVIISIFIYKNKEI
jgi:hypothetical protein